MPELVSRGPDIPVGLLNQLDDDRVVFFCGAGVSMGGGSQLPNFRDLLCHVYRENHLPPDEIEREALEDHAYDKVFERLERPERLGPEQVRQSVAACLSKEPAGPLHMHRDLLSLSLVEGGHRLVTTNFDNRFREAAREAAGLREHLQVHDAPALPVPTHRRWRTLVHLHGRIQPNGRHSELVLTSADFGRAYLTEGWAARFVSALFADFTVVFIGYSLSDPVMRYLVDAVATERAKGRDLGGAYAFAGYDPAKTTAESARAEWKARNVEPMPYDEGDDHSLLRRTLRRWVDIRRDPQSRARIALDGLGKLPNEREAARVTWALERPDVARKLAQAHPFTDEQDFPKIERWLDVFAEAGLLRRAADDPDGTDHPVRVNVVDDGSRSQSPPRLAQVTNALARWIARHVHVPQVFGWVVRRGGKVHPELRREVLDSLADPPRPIPSRLRLYWMVLLNEQVPDFWSLLFLEKQYRQAGSAEKRPLEDVLLGTLAPRLTVLPGSSERAVLQRRFDPEATPTSPIEDCGHLRVRVGCDRMWPREMTVLREPEFLCRHAERITTLLVEALVLLRHDDQVTNDPVTGRAQLFHRPHWIAAGTDRVNPRNAWTRLIDLARDSYFALAKNNRARADALLQRWAQSDEPTCKRLILHALAEDKASEADMADAVLLQGEAPGIWDPYVRNEVLRFLNKAGSRLRPSLVPRIVRAIHAEPGIGRSDRQEVGPEALDPAKVARLVELHLSGAQLDGESRTRAVEAARARSRSADDFDEVHRVFSPIMAEVVSGDEQRSRDLLGGPSADLRRVLCDESDGLSWEDLGAVVHRDAARVAKVLRECAERGKHPPAPWTRLMWHLVSMRREDKAAPDVEDDVLEVLSSAPDELFVNVTTALADFLRAIGDTWDSERESEFRVLWEKTWISAASGVSIDNADPVTQALNHVSGKLAEAAIFRLSKHEPLAQSGLPSSVRFYFDTIATSPDAHPGRVLLAARLNFLFTVDPKWTEMELVRRLDPSANPSEALDLWAGFAWSPRLSPNLLQAIKGSYLAVLARDDLPSRTKRGLLGLLVAICLNIPEELTKGEVLSVIGRLSDSSLRVALWSLRDRLTGSPSERGQIWNDKVEPWLRDYWPREGGRNSAATSEAMIHLVIGSGVSFAEAVSCCTPFLKPVESHHWDIVYLKEHIDKDPAAVLDLLSRVVQEELSQNSRPDLREILDAIAGVRPDLREDPRFRCLHQIASAG